MLMIFFLNLIILFHSLRPAKYPILLVKVEINSIINSLFVSFVMKDISFRMFLGAIFK